MTAHEQLIAYLATLVALVLALVGSMVVAALVPGVIGHIADFGVGTVTGGLIGVLRIPSARASATSETQDETLKAAVDKIPPTTGDAAAA